MNTVHGIWNYALLQSAIGSNNAKVLRGHVNAGATIAGTQYTYVKHLSAQAMEGATF